MAWHEKRQGQCACSISQLQHARWHPSGPVSAQHVCLGTSLGADACMGEQGCVTLPTLPHGRLARTLASSSGLVVWGTTCAFVSFACTFVFCLYLFPFLTHPLCLCVFCLHTSQASHGESDWLGIWAGWRQVLGVRHAGAWEKADQATHASKAPASVGGSASGFCLCLVVRCGPLFGVGLHSASVVV